MKFIAITSAIDAAICLFSWLILTWRRREVTGRDKSTARKIEYFSQYLLLTFAFLILIHLSILYFQGSTQEVMFFITDLVLWASLFYFILFMYEGKAEKWKLNAIVLFLFLAGLRSLFQLIGILDLEVPLGQSTVYILSNLDGWLMYAVWIPSAIVLIATAFQTESDLVRTRSLMFAIGLLLITFTWAFRLMGANLITTSLSLGFVSIASVSGFALLLSGILYRKQPA